MQAKSPKCAWEAAGVECGHRPGVHILTDKGTLCTECQTLGSRDIEEGMKPKAIAKIETYERMALHVFKQPAPPSV